MKATPILLAVLVTACLGDVATEEREVASEPRPDLTGGAGGDERPAFHRCLGRPFTAPGRGSFRHRRSAGIAELGASSHSAQDLLAPPGESVTISAKLAYGRLGKDLEDEEVAVFLDRCDGWSEIGTATTDGDGRTALSAGPGTFPGLGVFEVRQVVTGDGSSVTSRLTVAPPGTRFVVFDVDGTLTLSDGELRGELTDEYLAELSLGHRHPRAQPGAAAITRLWADKGYLVVYLTGRPYWLAERTRDWLREAECAEGHLHTTDRHRELPPTIGGVGEFKAAYLRDLLETGYLIDYAYGNAQSDIFAYTEAGLAPSRVYIIGEHGGLGGTEALRGGYVEHLVWAAAQPAAQQPFLVLPPR